MTKETHISMILIRFILTFGAVVGRYANRIKKGTFEIDDETYHVPRNENNGTNTLHGGTVGYDQRNWTVTSYNESSITFMLEDNGYEGFPGSVITYATYAVKTRDRRPILTTRLVSIPLDGATPILLSNHIYWSLNAFTDARNPTVLNDTLSLPYSNRYIETDKFLVPTGDINLVQDKAGTDFIEAIELGTNIKQAVGVVVQNALASILHLFWIVQGIQVPSQQTWSFLLYNQIKRGLKWS